MNKYHINPETGNPGLCSAKINCPFGGDDVHYFSKEAAQKAFEEATKEEALKVWRKKKVAPEPAAPEPTVNSSGSHGSPVVVSHGRAMSGGHGSYGAPPPAPKPVRAKPAVNYGGHGSPGGGVGRGGHGY